MTGSGGSRFRLQTVDVLWLFGLLISVAGIYLSIADSWGFWEPWETEYAQLGRRLNSVEVVDPTSVLSGAVEEQQEVGAFHVQQSTWLVPRTGEGEILNKAWLGNLLLSWGYTLGDGGEWGLRIPLIVLALIVLLSGYLALRTFVTPGRAGLSMLILASSPVFLMSAVNLAGVMAILSTTSLALCCFAVGLFRLESRLLWSLAGLFTGLTLWAGGIHGLVIVLATLGCVSLWLAGRCQETTFQKRHLIILSLLALVGFGPGLVATVRNGMEPTLDLIGLTFPVTACLIAVSFAWLKGGFTPSQRRGLLISLVLFLVTALPPIAIVWGKEGGETLLEMLLLNDLLNRSSQPGHVSFDIIIRQIGFSTFPYVVFFPLALAYLSGWKLESAEEDREQPESVNAMGGLHVLLSAWFAMGMLVVGLSATLTQHYFFSAVFPMAVGISLMLTDGGFWRRMKRQKVVHFAIGIGCIAVMMVLLKDLRTVQDLEMGQRGPEVLFELFLVDGGGQFPESYRLPWVFLFRNFWIIFFALYFFLVLPWQFNLTEKLSDSLKREDGETTGSKLSRMFRAVVRILLRGIVPVMRVLAALLAPFRWFFSSGVRFAVVFVTSGLIFAGMTGFTYLPSLGDHLSHRGLLDTYRAVADPGEVIYWVGSRRSSGNYYMGEDTILLPSGEANPVDEIRVVSALRPYFCQPEERVFALLDRDDLAHAYYEIRRNTPSDDESSDCYEGRDLWVLDARSSRYLLVSNQANPETEPWWLPYSDTASEEDPEGSFPFASRPEPGASFSFMWDSLYPGTMNQNPLSEHIFTHDSVPDDLIEVDPEYTFDNAIKIIGYRVVNAAGDIIVEASSGDVLYLETYFEVIWNGANERPSNREMFIHVDYGNQRLNGDHDLVDGIFPLNYWVPGEIVRDRYELVVDRGSAAGNYGIHIGFFSGDSRMITEPTTPDNRIRLGFLRITGGL